MRSRRTRTWRFSGRAGAGALQNNGCRHFYREYGAGRANLRRCSAGSGRVAAYSNDRDSRILTASFSEGHHFDLRYAQRKLVADQALFGLEVRLKGMPKALVASYSRM